MDTTRNQTFPIIFPAGTPAGLQEKTIQLDRKFDRATGWVVYVNTNGGAAYLRVGLRDDNKDVQSVTNVQHLQAGIDCPKPARTTPVEALADGTNLYVQVQFPTQLDTELNLDVVFTLVKKGE